MALQLRSHLSYSQGKYTASHIHLSMELEGFHLPSTPCAYVYDIVFYDDENYED